MDFIIFVFNFVFSVWYVLFALRALLPWIPYQKRSPLIDPVYRATEPVLGIVRAGMPPAKIGMDVSPFVVIILLWVLHQVVLKFINLFSA